MSRYRSHPTVLRRLWAWLRPRAGLYVKPEWLTGYHSRLRDTDWWGSETDDTCARTDTINEEVAKACAALLIEIAFLLPCGTKIGTHSVGMALRRYTKAVRTAGERDGLRMAATYLRTKKET